MRGRTLNDSFVILDEAQNTTVEQMKMFLTRIGFGSIAVVTGDVTQTDLPRHVRSGLRDAIDVLRDVDGISFIAATLCAPIVAAQTYSGLESVEYHVRLDRHLVSNTNGGNILARAADGTLSVFTAAPSSPYGIELVAGVLWVLDSGRLKGYDIDSAAPVADSAIPDASFLNGIA